MIVDPKVPEAIRSQILKENPKRSFTKELALKANEFGCIQAKGSQDKFEKRGQPNFYKNMLDCQISKIGEVMAWEFLVPFFPNLSGPDWNHYTAKDKNWKEDLIDITTDPPTYMGVKTQEIRLALEKDIPISWVCEYTGQKWDTDKGLFSEEAKTPGHYITCVSIDLQARTADIQAILAVSTLHERKLFEPMKVKHLQSNKVAIYLGSIKEKVI